MKNETGTVGNSTIRLPSIQFVDGEYIQENEYFPKNKRQSHVELTTSNQQSPKRADRVWARSISNITAHAPDSRPNRISHGVSNLNQIRPTRVTRNSMVAAATVRLRAISTHSTGCEKPVSPPNNDSPNLPITPCDTPHRYFY
jgi:hypothetical protein